MAKNSKMVAHGLVCKTGAYCVQRLDLSHNQLTGAIPAEMPNTVNCATWPC